MPFVKLDCNMLTSTIWYDKPARDVFITALLLAEPRYFEQNIDQIEVRSLNNSGWSAPAGWYGFVPAAGPRIVDFSGQETEIGIKALERLGSPEPESRTKEHEGRRMIRVDGGYLILNYFKYREMDYTAAARQKRYRDKKTAPSDTPTSHRNIITSHRDITQAEIRSRDQRSDPEENTDCAEPKTASTPALLVFPCQGEPNTWDLTQEQVSEWTTLYPGLSVLKECRQAFAWVKASPSRRKTAGGMARFLVAWLGRTANRGQTLNGGPPGSQVPNRDLAKATDEKLAQLRSWEGRQATPQEIAELAALRKASK